MKNASKKTPVAWKIGCLVTCCKGLLDRTAETYITTCHQMTSIQPPHIGAWRFPPPTHSPFHKNLVFCIFSPSCPPPLHSHLLIFTIHPTCRVHLRSDPLSHLKGKTFARHDNQGFLCFFKECQGCCFVGVLYRALQRRPF